MLPFAGFGCFALYQAVKSALAGKYGEAAFLVVFGLVFCAAGFGIIYFTLFVGDIKTNAQKKLEKCPDQPWLVREDWAAGKAVGEGKTSIRFFGLFTLFWNAISWTVLIKDWKQFHREFTHGDYKVLFVFLFPLIGLGLLIYTFKLLRRRFKYGQPELQLSAVPIPIGGSLIARLQLPQGTIGFMQEFDLKLTCIGIRHGSDSANETFIWKEAKRVSTEPDGSIPIQFDIPLDASSTRPNPAETDGVFWKLEVKSRTEGVDFFEQYEVPIYKTALTPEQEHHAEAVAAEEKKEYEEEVAHYQLPPHCGITLDQSPTGEIILHFAANRYPVMALVLLVFALAATGGGIAIEFYRDDLLPKIFMGPVFLLVGLILFYSVFRILFGSYRTVLGSDSVRISKKFFGVGKEVTIPFTDINNITAKFNLTSGETKYYDIEIERKDESSVTAGSLIKDKVAADYLVEVLFTSVAASWQNPTS